MNVKTSESFKLNCFLASIDNMYGTAIFPHCVLEL